MSRPFDLELTYWEKGERPATTSQPGLERRFRETATKAGWTTAEIDEAIALSRAPSPLEQAQNLEQMARSGVDATYEVMTDRDLPYPTIDTTPLGPDPVGLAEIAERLGVAGQTARNWRTRGLLPEPSWTVSGAPAWPWSEIRAWAKRTDRLPEDA